MLVLAGGAFVGARYWQAPPAEYRRLMADPACDLRAGPCSVTADGTVISLAVTPRAIPLMRTLQLQVTVAGMPVDGVVVEVRGRNMDMGLNRTRLAATAAGTWRGETILPVCSQRRMEWEAAVRVAGAEWLEAPFRFHTERP
ncbi:MAG: hypothetical protein QNJ91_11245 [Gammaproteobacteria bacterium]|nr:hypothetical protein [Gammaproteobacteria bacterium]